MGHDRIAGVAYQADHLAKVNFLTTVHLNAARLHVGVEGIAVTAEIENDGVAVSFIQRGCWWVTYPVFAPALRR